MRITQKLMQNMVRQNTDRAARAVVESSRTIDEGTGISRPSQDPITAARLMALRDLDRELDRNDRNRNIVKTDLGQAETVLESIHGLLVDGQDIALAMVNDTMNADDRANAARQVRGMMSQALGLANRKDASGKFLFTGTAEGTTPYAGDGTYQGNMGERMVQVGGGVSVEGSIAGPDAFGDKGQVFIAFDKLATALEANDTAGIQTALEELGDARTIVSSGRTEVGERLDTLLDLDDISEGVRTQVGLGRADIEGVDVAAVAPAMASAQAQLEAVIASSKALMQQIGRGLLGS